MVKSLWHVVHWTLSEPLAKRPKTSILVSSELLYLDKKALHSCYLHETCDAFAEQHKASLHKGTSQGWVAWGPTGIIFITTMLRCTTWVLHSLIIPPKPCELPCRQLSDKLWSAMARLILWWSTVFLFQTKHRSGHPEKYLFHYRKYYCYHQISRFKFQIKITGGLHSQVCRDLLYRMIAPYSCKNAVSLKKRSP